MVEGNGEDLVEMPEHESPVQLSLEEAKRCPGAVVVMHGDWGGQVYLSCPARLVRCDDKTLKSLLRDIDTLAWSCNDGQGTRLCFERGVPGTAILGGMGGGEVTDEIWIHEEFEEMHLDDSIRSVILGQRSCLAEHAFAAEPKEGDDLENGYRCFAACCAAKAGCYQGEGPAKLDDNERACWRHRALEWLQADLADWKKKLDSGNQKDRIIVERALQKWFRLSSLAGLRDTDALAMLPIEEQMACKQFWAEVDSLLQKARVST